MPNDAAAPSPSGEGSLSRLQAAHARLSEAEKCRLGGNLDRARSLCEALLRDHSDYVGALQTLGVVHLGMKNHRQALSCFLQAAMHCPKDAVNLTNLANCYLRLDARELAVQALEAARRLAPDDPAIYWTLAEVHHADRDYEQAARSFEKVLALSPSQADAAHGLGDCYLHLGRIGEGAAVLKRAHELKPDSVAVLYTLSQLPADAVDIDVMGALDHVRRQEEQTEHEFDIRVAFTRAAALDKQGLHGKAWEELLRANRREFPSHEQAYRRHCLRVEAIRQAALQHPAFRAKRGEGGFQPLSLFIIGPSRSGKSTLERLVGQLAGVRRGFERRLIEPAARRAAQLSGLLTISDPADLPRALDDCFRDFYLRDLVEFAAGAKIVTDTHPGMIASVGRVAATVPNVRFVFVKRDPFDVALRIFMKPYRSGNHYAYDIGTIFEHLSWYYGMIDLWCAKLPAISVCIDFEEMIGEPATALRRVADLCGAAALDDPLPEVGDDRNCSQPYRKFIDAALRD